MEIVNDTGNTIYIEDIDLRIPYSNGDPMSIDPDNLKKSRDIRNAIINDVLQIFKYDENQQIEKSIVYLKNKKSSSVQEIPKSQEIPKEESISKPELTHNSDNIEVKIHGIFLDASGYGKVNRNIALKLHESGIKVQVYPKRSVNQLNESELKPIIELQKNKISKKHILIDSVIPTFSEMTSGKYKVLYTTIESYSVPKQFIDCCQLYNEIWVTSPWSESILKQYTDKPIYSIVTGVDNELYTENGPRFNLKPNIKDFVFISVFGWNYRKGYDVLLKAYFDEFSADDNVSLVIMSRYQGGQSRFHKNKIKEDIEQIMSQFPNKELPHVVRYSDILPEQNMPKLYRACNCFVLPTRGEGCGLPPLEASLCGLPIIMTNCSGQQVYLKEDNSYMLNIDNMTTIQPGQMGLHYWDGQKFPALTSEKTHHELKNIMRHVFNNHEEAKRKNNKLQKLILEKFTWTHTTNQIVDRLEKIWKEL